MDITPSIAIDPYAIIRGGQQADLILISHEHYKHCSPADVAKLSAAHTRIIANRSAAQALELPGVTVLRPWQTISFGRTSIRAVPAYTFRGDHPATRENLGFVISSNYTDVYYAGDTDFVPELRNLRCDIAILPISGKDGLMNLDAMVEFVESARPRVVIPSHFGGGLRTQTNVELAAFERALRGRARLVLPSEAELLAWR
ncbi:MAG: MBL fold metallo-hydrolase [Anaerolineae bacterium]|nr:MBL fold metallo-hydrolase [Anaerolineae bacterium]